jgi:hypothetical protein
MRGSLISVSAGPRNRLWANQPPGQPGGWRVSDARATRLAGLAPRIVGDLLLPKAYCFPPLPAGRRAVQGEPAEQWLHAVRLRLSSRAMRLDKDRNEGAVPLLFLIATLANLGGVSGVRNHTSPPGSYAAFQTVNSETMAGDGDDRR